MTLFGKGRSKMEVMAADFLPFERQLHFIVADADCNLHVLQFDPDRELTLDLCLRKANFKQSRNHYPVNVCFTNQPSTRATSRLPFPFTAPAYSFPLLRIFLRRHPVPWI